MTVVQAATAVALAVYLPALAGGAFLVWRRPARALYAFVVGLALHNVVLALLYGAGVRGAGLTAIQAWKEVLLGVALARVVVGAAAARRLPFRPRAVDALAAAFAAVVVLYAAVPQDALGGEADADAILYGLRHALLPVAAYALGRSLALGRDDLVRLGWAVLGTASLVAALGLAELYTVPVERWRDAGVPAYYREHLGFEYEGPGGMPENFAFNTGGDVYRRLVSTFVSPLATAFVLAVALLLAAAGGPLRRRGVLPLAALCAAALLFTLSRSTLLALAGALCVLAFARRARWPLAAAAGTLAAGVAFALAFTSVAPRTHFFPDELRRQEERAQREGDVPGGTPALDPSEPSVRSHLTSLRDGLERVARHPQGYGLGNAGAVARRQDVELKAGESNYTELGVETGVAGLGLYLAWSLALLWALLGIARAAGGTLARWAAAGTAGSLALVLALGVQTDAFGVPWLAYVVWSLAGATLSLPAALRRGAGEEGSPGTSPGRAPQLSRPATSSSAFPDGSRTSTPPSASSGS